MEKQRGLTAGGKQIQSYNRRVATARVATVQSFKGEAGFKIFPEHKMKAGSHDDG
jgi:hypothetical protein